MFSADSSNNFSEEAEDLLKPEEVQSNGWKRSARSGRVQIEPASVKILRDIRRTLSMMDRKEVITIVEDLNHVLDKDESEIQQLKEVAELLLKIKQITQKQQDLMKREISAMCSLVEEDQENISHICDEAKTKCVQKEANIKGQRSRTEHAKAVLQEQCLEVEKEKDELDRLQDKLAAERDAIENKTTKLVPQIRYDVKLCDMICRIRWQFDSDPDNISGYVCNKGDVKPFSLSRKQNSQFFITNYLWDLVEEGGPKW